MLQKTIKLVAVLLILLTPSLGKAQVYLEWVNQLKWDSSGFIKHIATDGLNNVYAFGHFTDTFDCDPGTSTFNLIGQGLNDVFISKYDATGKFLWAKSIGGNGSFLNGEGFTVDMYGNAYITGVFSHEVDFDPGASAFNMDAGSSYLSFMLKLDAAGNFAWAKSIGNGQTSSLTIGLDKNGYVYFGGIASDTLDFDPGAGIYRLGLPDFSAYILKLDTSGNFIWAKNVGSANTPGGQTVVSSITLDSFGNIYATGGFMGMVDFDPDLTVSNLTKTLRGTDMDAFISKLDSSGKLIWAKQFAGQKSVYIKSLELDASGNIYTTGSFNDRVDFDPGPGVSFLQPVNNTTCGFISKLNALGNFVWVKQLGGQQYVMPAEMKLHDSKYLFTLGSFRETVDFDPGPGIFNLSSGMEDAFIQKIDTSGNFIWARAITGSGISKGETMSMDNTGNIYFSILFIGNTDIDPGSGIHETVFIPNTIQNAIIKWSQDSCANLAIRSDSIAAISCLNPQGYIKVSNLNGTPPFTYSWDTTPAQDTNEIWVTTRGVYNVILTDSLGCTNSVGLLVDGPAYPAGYDLDVNLITSEFRPGFANYIVLDAYNDGCIPANGTLSIVLTNKLTFNSSIPAPDQISGDTLSWNFNNLTAQSQHLVPRIFITTNATTPLGDTVQLSTFITPVNGDEDTANNTKTYTYEVIGSYDPNDKHVYPAGACEEKYVVINKPLTYTVNFQNTGTASAINVYILDTLSSALNPKTIKIIGTSHEMFPEVLPGNILKFNFDNIYLPDSNHNEPESHGYVIFQISPDSNLASSMVIKNEAAIYFDFNEPIFTNKVMNTAVKTIPLCNTPAAINGVDTYQQSILLYPNPANNMIAIEYQQPGTLLIIDILGKTQQAINLDQNSKKQTISISNLPSGIYTYKYLIKNRSLQSGKIAIIR